MTYSYKNIKLTVNIPKTNSEHTPIILLSICNVDLKIFMYYTFATFTTILQNVYI